MYTIIIYTTKGKKLRGIHRTSKRSKVTELLKANAKYSVVVFKEGDPAKVYHHNVTL